MRESNQRQDRKGAALLLVMFAIAFIAVLAVAILEAATTDLMILRNHSGGQRALYAAHAGVAAAIAALRVESDYDDPLSGALAGPDGTTCAYSVAIAEEKPVFTITAKGTAGEFIRVVRARVVVDQKAYEYGHPVRVMWWQDNPDAVVFY